jgi:hypothetical protein
MTKTPGTIEASPSAAAEFDPYFKWLGIPPDEQPPTHYRLLAIPPFTSDPEVIENAADQRMAHLKSVQTGKRGALSQTLLDQIAQARTCLLDHQQKATYDQALRSSLAPPISPPPVQTEVEPPIVEQGQSETTSPRATPRQSASPTMELLKIVLGGIAGLALGYLLICWISPRNDFFGVFTNSKTTVENSPQPTPVVKANRNPEHVDPVIEKAGTKVHPSESAPKNTAPEQKPEPVAVAPVPADKQATLAAERDAAVGKGDLAAALRAVRELATLNGRGELEEQLSLISMWKAESPTTRRDVATQLAKLLEQAIAEGKFDLTARHVDQLVALARSLDDQELERRATLIALKRPAGPTGRPETIVPPTVTETPKPPPNEVIEQLLASIPKSRATIRNGQGRLTDLDCGGVVLTDSQLEAIGSVESLKVLYLPHTKLNDAGLEKLSGLSSLTVLGIWNTEVSSEGMRHIAKFKLLKSLSLEGNGKVGDQGVAHLSVLADLSDLGLSWTGVTDDGLRHLVALPSLKSLGLNHTKITDRGLEHLAQIKTLNRLSIVETAVTDAGVTKFRTLLPSCEVVRVKQ